MNPLYCKQVTGSHMLPDSHDRISGSHSYELSSAKARTIGSRPSKLWTGNRSQVKNKPRVEATEESFPEWSKLASLL